MTKPPEKIILYSSDEAAKRATVTGWVSRGGLFFGDNEHSARWQGATHMSCKKCGTVHDKNKGMCDPCRSLQIAAAWDKLEKRPWDGTTPVTVHDGDEFFMSAEEFIEWCAENEVEPEGVHLVHCKPQGLRELDDGHFAEYERLPEDFKVPPEIAKAIEDLNAAIRAHTEPVSWWADNVAVDPESLKGLEVTP